MGEIEEKRRKLDKTIAALQDKWGKQAIQRFDESRREVAHVSTGFPSLDEKLGIGGLPRGRISEILGKPTSGLKTIALKIAENVQKDGGLILYFDQYQTFDPEYTDLLGVNLNQLVLLRPNDIHQSAIILLDAVVSGGIGLIIVETQADNQASQIWSLTLDKIIAPLGHSETILLFLTHLPAFPAANPVNQYKGKHRLKIRNVTMVSHYAALRLIVQRSGWLIQGRELEGYKTQVKVIKNKFGPTGGVVDLTIPIIYSKFFQYKST
jgi:recombination protein RecA